MTWRSIKYKGLLVGTGLLALQQRPICAQQAPSSEDAARIRAELIERQRTREADADRVSLVPLQATGESAPVVTRDADEKDERNPAWVRITQQMSGLNAQVVFERRGDRGTTESRKTLLVVPGRQWLALPAGEWRLRIIAGPGGGAAPVVLPVEAVTLRRNQVYALDFTNKTEQALSQMLREKERARREALREQEPRQQKPERKPQVAEDSIPETVVELK